MKTLDLATIALLIVGGLNWGLVGVADWNLVAALLGAGSVLSRLVYVVVGVSAIWQIGRLVSEWRGWGGALHAA
jgi:uncharacterized membrane protein YuzA (DUF378 family)